MAVDLAVEFGQLGVLLRERPDHPDGRDPLGEQGVDRRDLRPDRQREGMDPLREEPVVDRVDRQDHERRQRQPPLEPEHHRGDPEPQNQVVDQLERPAVEEDEDRPHVARHPGHQAPRLLGVEVGHRQPHELALQGPAEGDDQLLARPADRRRYPPDQPHPPEVAGNRPREHRRDQPTRLDLLIPRRSRRPPDQRDEVVDDDPLQHRDRQHQARRQQQPEDPPANRPPVRAEELAEHPPEAFATMGGVGRRAEPVHVHCFASRGVAERVRPGAGAAGGSSTSNWLRQRERYRPSG